MVITEQELNDIVFECTLQILNEKNGEGLSKLGNIVGRGVGAVKNFGRNISQAVSNGYNQGLSGQRYNPNQASNTRNTTQQGLSQQQQSNGTQNNLNNINYNSITFENLKSEFENVQALFYQIRQQEQARRAQENNANGNNQNNTNNNTGQ